MLSAAAVALALAGLAAGLTGTWSPCGFSMIDTLGPAGHPGGRRRTIAACAAFAVGAPLGGAVTFGALSALGAALQGGGAAFGVAVAIAVVAAGLDVAGVRIAPQLRRQVPESWRRVLPLPVAGLLYGVLPGLGFTTYVLSFALPALAAISVAVADVQLGLVLGVAFGVGRALPIVVLAPVADAPLGARAITAMADRPALLRGARAADALTLLIVAGALAAGDARAADRAGAAAARSAAASPPNEDRWAGSGARAWAAAGDRWAITGGLARAAAAAARPVVIAAPATDPTVDVGALAWSVPGGEGMLTAGGPAAPVGGRRPALGGGRLAVVVADGTVSVVDRATGAARSVPAAAGADALAVSARWLAWRLAGPDRLVVLDLLDPAAAPRAVARVGAPGTLSRPALDGDRLAWAVATRRGSSIRALDLATPGARTVTLRREARVLLTAPALWGGVMAWVRVANGSQQLLLAPAQPGRGGRRLLRLSGVAGRDGGREHGHTGQGRRPEDRAGATRPARSRLLGTALDPTFAYVTRQPRNGGAPEVIRVAR